MRLIQRVGLMAGEREESQMDCISDQNPTYFRDHLCRRSPCRFQGTMYYQSSIWLESLNDMYTFSHSEHFGWSRNANRALIG
jgi:hypothetical protein